ncbi:hypothetical protein ACGFXC_09155 [Streptomyces sp. NPDC048507]|uniref:hypothetical protein n=1 Tax=Streptomyces sp. NPDC048507 TaxID=3365560 RepID=UPI00371CB13B
MTKRGLTHPDHLRLGQILQGLQVELQRAEITLENAYPRSGPGAFPAAKLGEAGAALLAARRELENFVYAEHGDAATTEDYFPDEEHQAKLDVPMKLGRVVRGRCPSGGRARGA